MLNSGQLQFSPSCTFSPLFFLSVFCSHWSDIWHLSLVIDFNGLIDLDLIKRLKLIWEIEQNAQSDASEQLLWTVLVMFLKSFWKVFEKSRFTRRWVIEGAQSDGRITTGAVTALSSFCLEKSSEWQFEWRHPGAGSVWLETTFLNRTLLLLNFTELSWVWILQTGAGSVWLETTFLNRTLLLLNFTELYWVWILQTGAGSVWLETTFLNRTLLLLNFTELYWVWILHTGAGSVGS